MEQQELADILREMHETAEKGEKGTQILLFGIKYAAELERHSILTITELNGVPETYGREIYKGVKLAKYVELKQWRSGRNGGTAA